MANSIILLGSVLKPIDDSRMYEKIGRSVSKIDKAEIHIAGFESIKKPSAEANIRFHPLYSFPRLSIRRIFAGWKFFRLLVKVSPKLTIVNTHELLIVTILYQILFGCKIIYDVQENYFKNLLYGKQFPPPINILLALYVRVIELCSYPFISKYILAERCYFDEMPFVKSKSVIIENKVLPPPNIGPIGPGTRSLNRKKVVNLIYTGTIAEVYGIFDAITIAKTILDNHPGVFTIIGYAPDSSTYKALEQLVKEDPRIQLIGGDELIPHSQIIEAIRKSDLGIVSYKPNKATSQRIPTRFYEYIAYKLPFIYPDNKDWINLCSRYPAGIPVNYNKIDISVIMDQVINSKFYQNEPGSEISWAMEEDKLLVILEKVLAL